MKIEEGRGEDLRLLYVAVTRAQHQAVLWWAGTHDSEHSPLSRLLFDRTHTAASVPTPAGATPTPTWTRRSPRSGHVVSNGPRRRPPRGGGRARRRPSSRRPCSTGPSTPPGVGSPTRASPAPARAARDRERARARPDLGRGRAGPARPADAGRLGRRGAAGRALHLGAMPGGARVGTVVHRVLEHTDFDAADLVAGAGPHWTARSGGAASTSARSTRWWRGSCRHRGAARPVGGSMRLADVARRERLDELGFELPLVGGDDAAGTATSPTWPTSSRRSSPPATRGPLRRGAEGPGPQRRPPRLSTGSIDLVSGSPTAATSSSTTRPTGSGPRTRRSPPGTTAARRWTTRCGGPLPAAGAALLGRPPSLPALAPAGLRPRAPPRRRALPLRPRHERGRSRRARRVLGVWSWRPRGRGRGAERPLRSGGGARRGSGAQSLRRHAWPARRRAPGQVQPGRDPVRRRHPRGPRLAGSAPPRRGGAPRRGVGGVGPRLGHVCVDLPRSVTRPAPTSSRSDLAALPWPEPGAWVRTCWPTGWPASTARSAVDGAALARPPPGPPRPAGGRTARAGRTARRVRGRGAARGGLGRLFPRGGPRPPALAAAGGGAAEVRSSPAVRALEDDDRRPRAGTPRRAGPAGGCGPCRLAAPRARRPPASRRPCAGRRPGSTSPPRPDSGSAGSGNDTAPPAGFNPATAPASVTTANRLPQTSSSSTRRRWCRCR